jgi:RND family efflux transporter MFP subunit
MQINKRIIFSAIIIVVAVVGSVYFLRPKAPDYITAAVQKGTIVQEVSASGSVEPPTTLGLYFTSSGKLTVLAVGAGDRVSQGQVLAKLDTAQLEAQLAQMQAGVNAAQAKLDQLFAGASSQDIAVSRTAVANAQAALQNAQAAGDNAKQSAINTIRDAYSKTDDAIRNHVDRLFLSPTGQSPSFGAIIVGATAQYNIIAASDTENMINGERKDVERILEAWEATSADSIGSSLDSKISASSGDLRIVQNFLNDVAAVVNSFNSVNLASDTVYQNYRNDVLTARTAVDTAITNVTAAAGALKSAKTAIDAASGALNSAQDSLTLKAEPARQADVALDQSQIDQARAAMRQVQTQINNLTIAAPDAGIVIRTNGNVGEVATPAVSVVSLIPTAALQVKLNVSEDNVANVVAGQIVKMTLDALGGAELGGKVISIEPAGTIISGAVYYKTTVALDNPDSRIRPDMTVNAQIETAVRQNALAVPISALQSSAGKTFVQMLSGKNAVQKDVTTGIESQDGRVEILSGLAENDQVIIGAK